MAAIADGYTAISSRGADMPDIFAYDGSLVGRRDAYAGVYRLMRFMAREWDDDGWLIKRLLAVNDVQKMRILMAPSIYGRSTTIRVPPRSRTIG